MPRMSQNKQDKINNIFFCDWSNKQRSENRPSVYFIWAAVCARMDYSTNTVILQMSIFWVFLNANVPERERNLTAMRLHFIKPIRHGKQYRCPLAS